jgi:ribonuclease HII
VFLADRGHVVLRSGKKLSRKEKRKLEYEVCSNSEIWYVVKKTEKASIEINIDCISTNILSYTEAYSYIRT